VAFVKFRKLTGPAFDVPHSTSIKPKTENRLFRSFINKYKGIFSMATPSRGVFASFLRLTEIPDASCQEVKRLERWVSNDISLTARDF